MAGLSLLEKDERRRGGISGQTAGIDESGSRGGQIDLYPEQHHD